ncbi:MAG TPA: CoA transferase [Caulobacteraceae bacterium]|nr:CoA transferase [Caulobacteraceae bacterium]
MTSPIAAALHHLAGRIAELTENFGRRVEVDALGIMSREGLLDLKEPGLWSPNRACRLLRAKDAWIAINLAREEDRDLVPAWLCADVPGDTWDAIVEIAATRPSEVLIQQAILLGLPAALVGERVSTGFGPTPPQRRDARGAAPIAVVDLSALWAGPMCGAILAAMGARVVKLESPRRPDPTRVSSAEFFKRLNAQKRCLEVDFATAEGQAELRAHIAAADVLITSCRPRALPSLGLDAERILRANPRLTWVAITGYGWRSPDDVRVAFGDDAAAAGGLVDWTPAGQPQFLGDALSDPVTGLGAAVGALEALGAGGGARVEVAMADCAAAAAAMRNAG